VGDFFDVVTEAQAGRKLLEEKFKDLDVYSPILVLGQKLEKVTVGFWQNEGTLFFLILDDFSAGYDEVLTRGGVRRVHRGVNLFLVDVRKQFEFVLEVSAFLTVDFKLRVGSGL